MTGGDFLCMAAVDATGVALPRCSEVSRYEDVPKEYRSGPWLLAPGWPGIYRIE
jgi:hypothetical protein